MTKTDEQIRHDVRASYATAATSSSCCGPAPSQLGYDPAELAGLPDEAIMGLGCGNPVALAAIAEGDTVVDLGSGGGIDVFLAARRTGATGRVIGVDMTPEMLERARANAGRLALGNVEFRLGLIEQLPVEQGSVDVVISNCVINLSPDKASVFREVARVLRPGGRMVVSDLVTKGRLPAEVADDPEAWAACIGGALPEAEYLEAIAAAGLDQVTVLERRGSGPIYSITVEAVRR